MSFYISSGFKVKCNKCSSQAIVRVPYAKLNLCREHYLKYIESRVYKFIEKRGLLKGVNSLLVALSGGKDSLSLLYILNELKDALGLKAVYGVHLDLGIGLYSEMSRKAVELACENVNAKCFTVALSELVGHTLPELVKLVKRPACSLCGMIKRYFINLFAVELGVDAVSLGHHMDDILVFILKDFMLQDLVDMSKMVPAIPGIPGIATSKLKLLYETYENDLLMYASLRNIKYVETDCPFKYRDPFKASIRKMLDELEEVMPGFKLSLARRIFKNLSKYVSANIEKKVVPCKYCGMPSSTGTCAFCRLTERATGAPLGPVTRERIKNIVKLARGY
ncbi:MAG: ATP-binding protein [Desulfurococcaceae archaeon]